MRNMEQFKDSKIWVAWKTVTRDNKKTKPPFQQNGTYASTSNPKTWMTFSEASSVPGMEGVGIILGQEHNIVGVDFDAIFPSSPRLPHEPLPSSVPKKAKEFLNACKTYIEYSPSKTGLHALFKLTKPLILEANKYNFETEPIDPSLEKPPQVEVYTSGRFFTYTNDLVRGSKPILEVTPNEFVALLKILGYPWKEPQHPTPSPSPSPVSLPPPLSDEDVLSKMFSSKNGRKIKEIYNTNPQDESIDTSSKDFSFLLHLAFWTQKNSIQMERIWLASPLGDRQKVQGREDYRNRTITNAIEATQEVYTPHASVTTQDEDGNIIDYEFVTRENKDGTITIPCIFPNILRVFRKHPLLRDRLRRNTFSNMTEVKIDGEWENLTDAFILKAREQVAEEFSVFNRVSKDLITDAILTVSYDNKINPPRDYLTSLTWDRIPRLNSWIHETYGTPDDVLHQSMGANWMKGLVKRIMMPGCQFDEALALESPQGWRKSTSLRVLGAPWHVETAHSIDNKDFYILLAQNVIVEFSEGEIFDRTSMKKIKAEITKTEDQYRPPYERGMVKFPRSCVFAVTTNDLELKDDTGNRRWLPVILEKPANIEWLKKNKDQLFAEAFYRAIILKETSHEYPEELFRKQEERAETTSYDEQVVLWYLGLPEEIREDGVKIQDACQFISPGDKTTKADEMRMGGILRRILHLERSNRYTNGIVSKRWLMSDRTREIVRAYNESKKGELTAIPF